MPRHRNLLFVCSRNKLRSPTAEQVFSGYEGIEAMSAGISRDAVTPLDAELIAWADVIFVMEKSHLAKLRAKFRSKLNGQRVVCLDIPDDYDYMDPVLIDMLETKVRKFL